MKNQQTVLEFLEESKHPLPVTITIDRTTGSRYLFYLVVRHYRKTLSRRPQFVVYSKANVNSVKATIEEHSIFGDPPLYILEGFAYAFVESLSLPEGVYVVAETDGGDLKAPSYSYRLRRDILKVLIQQLKVRNVQLRPLVGLDWSSCRDYGDYESILRMAKVMGWNEEQIGDQLMEFQSGPVLSLTKRSQFKEIFSMMGKYGPVWMQSHLQEILVQTVHFKVLRLLGYDNERIQRDLEIGPLRMAELEEGARSLSQEEMLQMAERMVRLDRLILRNRELGMSLLFLNAPFRLIR